MARPGPPKQFPNQIKLPLDDESEAFLSRMAKLTGMTKQTIARIAIHQGIQDLQRSVSELAERLVDEHLKEGKE